MQEVQELMQVNLDEYGAGVTIRVVQLQAAVPPATGSRKPSLM